MKKKEVSCVQREHHIMNDLSQDKTHNLFINAYVNVVTQAF